MLGEARRFRATTPATAQVAVVVAEATIANAEANRENRLLQAALESMHEANARAQEAVATLQATLDAAEFSPLPPPEEEAFAASNLAALLDTQGFLRPPVDISLGAPLT